MGKITEEGLTPEEIKMIPKVCKIAEEIYDKKIKNPFTAERVNLITNAIREGVTLEEFKRLFNYNCFYVHDPKYRRISTALRKSRLDSFRKGSKGFFIEYNSQIHKAWGQFDKYISSREFTAERKPNYTEFLGFLVKNKLINKPGLYGFMADLLDDAVQRDYFDKPNLKNKSALTLMTYALRARN